MFLNDKNHAVKDLPHASKEVLFLLLTRSNKKSIMKTILSILICLLTWTNMLYAQLTVTGEIRPRIEFRNGFKKLTEENIDPALFTEQRSRLYFDYKVEKYQLRLTIQDIRIWGANDQIHKNDNAMSNINEAWAKYMISSKLGIKMGRQIISYDNQRFLGGLEWAQQGRRHDALLLVYEDDDSKMKIHGGLAFNQDSSIPEPKKLSGHMYAGSGFGKNYKSMQYIWAHKEYENTSVSVLFFNEENQYDTAKTSLRQTTGLVASQKINNLKVAGEGYFQMGEFEGNTVSAYMLNLNLTYKTSFAPITIAYEVLSGDDSEESQINQFNPAYGTNHAHNGFMDYFYVGNPHDDVGLQDIYLKTKIQMGDKSNLMAKVHQFLSAVDVQNDTGGDMSRALGTEVDLVYAHKFSHEVTLNIGYSQMFATKTMEQLKDGGDKSTSELGLGDDDF